MDDEVALMDQIMDCVRRSCTDHARKRRSAVKESDDALQFARILQEHWKDLHAFNVPLRRKQVYDDIIAELPDNSPFKAIMCKPNRRKKFVDSLIAKAKRNVEKAKDDDKCGIVLNGAASEADQIFASLEIFDETTMSGGTSRDSPTCNGFVKCDSALETCSSPVVSLDDEVAVSTTSRKSLEDTIFFVKNVKDEWSSIREYISDKYSPVAAQAWERIEEKYKLYGWPWKSYCTCSERWRGLTKRYKQKKRRFEMAGKRFPESELDRLMEEMMDDVLNYGDRRERNLIELMNHIRSICEGLDVERLKLSVFEAIARSVPSSNMFSVANCGDINAFIANIRRCFFTSRMHLEKIRETGPLFSKPLQKSELMALALQGYDVSEFVENELRKDKVVAASSSESLQKGKKNDSDKRMKVAKLLNKCSNENKNGCCAAEETSSNSGSVVASLLARICAASKNADDEIDLSQLVAGPSNANSISNDEKCTTVSEKPLREYPRTEGVLEADAETVHFVKLVYNEWESIRMAKFNSKNNAAAEAWERIEKLYLKNGWKWSPLDTCRERWRQLVKLFQEKTKKSEFNIELTNEVDLLMKEMVDDGKELEEKRERDLLEIATELKKHWPELQKAFGPQRRKILDGIVESLPQGNSYIPALKDPRPISYTIFRNVLRRWRTTCLNNEKKNKNGEESKFVKPLSDGEIMLLSLCKKGPATEEKRYVRSVNFKWSLITNEMYIRLSPYTMVPLNETRYTATEPVALTPLKKATRKRKATSPVRVQEVIIDLGSEEDGMFLLFTSSKFHPLR
ncbi:unnamed protein product [Anisakis simplex]|uniref:MADF domain-containing protein n=1 Tax=Anisakis simplex TaxID=6269 RepID=A0A0M3JWB6_ANISI|nr:unnamed protein product [Anisakis simplex]